MGAGMITDYMIIAYRQKTGCRQYVFNNYIEFIRWSNKKPQVSDNLSYHVFENNKFVSEEIIIRFC